VLVTSSEAEELLVLSDRLVVLNEGRVAGETATAATSPDRVLSLFAAAAGSGTTDAEE
jgi:ribose transport system ATP-binding protein